MSKTVIENDEKRELEMNKAVRAVSEALDVFGIRDGFDVDREIREGPHAFTEVWYAEHVETGYRQRIARRSWETRNQNRALDALVEAGFTIVDNLDELRE